MRLGNRDSKWGHVMRPDEKSRSTQGHTSGCMFDKKLSHFWYAADNLFRAPTGQFFQGSLILVRSSENMAGSRCGDYGRSCSSADHPEGLWLSCCFLSTGSIEERLSTPKG